MLRRLAITLLSTQVLLLAGCSYLKYPDVHKLTIAQGNIINQEMVDQLRPGLSRSQVRYILGTPLIANTFDQSRWDYFFSIKRPGRDELRERVSVYFSDDKLSHFTGDYLPTNLVVSS
ncbi:MAG: outer membrane protein assembly factor BamE, partial [Porticoccaceae bacterium]|nr:outer membrane protein assembly factor BamE [Porticoccaceae bacterium]